MSRVAIPWARFDDMRTGAALRFPPAHEILSAERLEDVPAVIRAVDDVTSRGAWAFGFVSYEAAAGLDPSLPRSSPAELPLAWFGICGPPARAEPVRLPARDTSAVNAWQLDWSDAQYTGAVTTVREHIAAGETYQCNLTDRMRARLNEDPLDLYDRLVLAQRGAYNAFLDLGRTAIASASPELFFEWTGDRVRTRPMKGTAPRGRNVAEDHRHSCELRTSDKEQAENLMIVDLLRNDLGRICEVGSVQVDELFSLEQFPTVWQLTSQISGRLRAGTGLLELFRALFPCGSVTGAPKQRTMQLIHELEAQPRGVYCGAIGWVAPPWAPVRARFNVAIRTAVVDKATSEAVYGVGGGITWGSDPVRERAELHAKAAVLVHETTEHRLVETLAFDSVTGLRNLTGLLARMSDSADWFGYRFESS